MNQEEATKIVTVLNRAGLLWAMEGQAAVWAMALEDVSFVTAQEVVRDMTAHRTSAGRSVTPGDIREAVRVIRSSRTARMSTPQPPETLDGNWEREQEWIRHYVRAIGDGQNEATADRTACQALGVARPVLEAAARPVNALIHQAARNTHIPRKDQP